MNNSELKALCLAIAPELKAAPLYVLAQDDATMPPAPAGCLGFAQPINMRPRLRSRLIDRGQWEGPGPGIILQDGLSPNETLAVLAHELAHLVPHKPPPPDVEPDEVDRFVDDLVIKHDARGDLNEPTRPPWHPFHGKEFTRIACHVFWRFPLLADLLPPADIAAGPKYALSCFPAYLKALDSEPLRLRNEDFATILSIQPTEEFENLWANDVGLWTEQRVEAELKSEPTSARRSPA